MTDDESKYDEDTEQYDREPERRYAKELLHEGPLFMSRLLSDWCPGQDLNLYALSDSRF